MIASSSELVYFHELTHTLNFSRAAERLGISQPSLSVAIKRLEQTLDIELFIRGKNGVTLTPAGKRLLSHTKQLLQLWETVKTETWGSHHEAQGLISLACHSSLGLYILPKILPTLIADHPKLEIKLKHDISRKILEDIINLTIDLGLIVNPIKHPDLIILKLYDDKVAFWQSAHPKKNLSNPVIICDPELTQTQVLLKKLHKMGFKYQRMITTSSLELIASLTAQGAGIGILPTTIASTLDMKLKPLNKMPYYKDEICLVYRNENRNIKAMQIIIQAIKKWGQA